MSSPPRSPTATDPIPESFGSRIVRQGPGGSKGPPGPCLRTPPGGWRADVAIRRGPRVRRRAVPRLPTPGMERARECGSPTGLTEDCQGTRQRPPTAPRSLETRHDGPCAHLGTRQPHQRAMGNGPGAGAAARALSSGPAEARREQGGAADLIRARVSAPLLRRPSAWSDTGSDHRTRQRAPQWAGARHAEAWGAPLSVGMRPERGAPVGRSSIDASPGYRHSSSDHLLCIEPSRPCCDVVQG